MKKTDKKDALTKAFQRRFATTEDRLKKRLLFIGWLTAELAAFQTRPILVGGHALEFYTLGDYVTRDVDLVCHDADIIGQLLQEAHFQREGRHWYHPDLDIAVEIPASVLAGSLERVEQVAIEEYVVYVIGKEDLLIDRLNACVHWNSDRDCHWALELMILYRGELDWPYLVARAQTERTHSRLLELRAKAEEFSGD